MIAHELDSTFSTVEAFAKENGLKVPSKAQRNENIVRSARIKASYITSPATHAFAYPGGNYRGK